MLLFNSSLLCSSSSPTTVTLSPPKSPTSKPLILRTPCFILRHYFQQPLPCSPLFAKTTLTQQHVYPDPIPEFAEYETRKFKVELLQKLSEDVDDFGDELDAVVDVCVQIFSKFLHKEYGGPGTLLVTPFTDMLVALKKKKLPGAPLAARASLLWAQNYVDEDWKIWNSKLK
ncbi:unnamed protein product [Vicia faba]|uniref:Protein PLASTID REDOX INSENSITIVE 2, chloroplastic n=1 Tax=Vicia faba TaxID=3906 RepID=A0AAV1AH82_VICFA|nr:unnamed protein product [Vicia faba]